jgi:hypothetical protein
MFVNMSIKESPNADFNLTKAFVTQFAVLKDVSKLRANSPLQVKSMLE